MLADKILEAARANRSAPVDVVRDLIRRVIQSGGTDIEANELVEFLRVSKGARRDLEQLALPMIHGLVMDILADGTLMPDEDVQLKGALISLCGDSSTSLGDRVDLELHVARARAGLIESVTTELILDPGEVAVETSHAWLKAEKSKTRFVSGNAGVTVPIGRLRVRVGGTSGEMFESAPVSTRVDFGEVTVTTTRTVFAGEKRTIAVPHTHLLAAATNAEELTLHWDGRGSPITLEMAAPSATKRLEAAIDASVQASKHV